MNGPRLSRAGTVALVSWLAVAPTFGSPAPWTVTLDPETTTIQFVLGATLHKVHGTFRLTDGSLKVDPETGKIDGAIRVNARTGDTENPKRDGKMHEKVLESGRFPEIVLTPERIDGTLGSEAKMQFQLLGTLRVHGDSHAVTLPVDAEIDGDRFTARSVFDVPYVEWGMADPSVFLLRVDKSVTVTVEAHGTIQR